MVTKAQGLKGEMMVSRINSSDASEQRQDSPDLFHFQTEESVKFVFDTLPMKTPEEIKAMVGENVGVESLSLIPGKETSRLRSGRKRRTPKQKGEPLEALLGIRHLRMTPKHKLEPAEALSDITELTTTPKRKPEPIDVLSGVKEVKRSPNQELEPVTAGIGSQRLRETPAQEGEAVKDVAGVTSARKTPKLKHQPAEAMAGVRRIFKTPEGKVERRADGFGVGTSVKTRREKYPPVEDFVGLQRLMAEPKQKWSDFEEDYVGLAELFETPEEAKVGSGSFSDCGVDDREEMLHFFNKIPAAGSDSPALNHRQWAGNAQAVLKPKQTEIPQENPAQKNGTGCRRVRGRKLNFELDEGSSQAGGGRRSLPECEKGMTCKDGQRETPENPSLQVRRSRRRQVESIPQVPCVPSMENQTRIAGDSKDEASLKEQDSGLAATPSSTQENPLRRGKRREVAAASPTPRSPPVKRRGLPKGDDKKMSVREEENPSLGNKSLPAKTNASARGARKKIDLGGEVETGNIEERTNEEQNMSLETVSRAKEKPLGRGRRTGTARASHTTNPISLRGKRRLPADSGREEAPKEYRNVPLQTFDSPVKEDQLRRGRRIGIALVVEGTSSVLGNQGLSKESTRKKLILANHGTPEEQQNRLMAVAPLAKGNPSGVVRKKRIASRCEETTSPFLGKDPVLPRDKCQKRIKTQEVAPEQQATASSLRRKCQLPADDLASKKPRSECDENKSLQKGRRKKNQEELAEEDVRAPQTTGGMDRKTRSSTRTSARTRK